MSHILFSWSLPWPLWMYTAVNKKRAIARLKASYKTTRLLETAGKWLDCVAVNVFRTPLMKRQQISLKIASMEPKGFYFLSLPSKSFPPWRDLCQCLVNERNTEKQTEVIKRLPQVSTLSFYSLGDKWVAFYHFW